MKTFFTSAPLSETDGPLMAYIFDKVSLVDSSILFKGQDAKRILHNPKKPNENILYICFPLEAKWTFQLLLSSLYLCADLYLGR
ncbi:MAG: hypothetical protein ACI9VN_001303 [Patescibacteria group bacterium]|jgi:hypothetical protein